jgi:hypothetical protein
MWRELVQAGDGIGARLHDAADAGAIAEARRAFGSAVPGALSSLVTETNGITDQFGYGIVWPVRELVDRNREMRETEGFRELYMPFDSITLYRTPVRYGMIRQ